MRTQVVTSVDIPGIPKRSGKVRDIFEIPDSDLLVIVSTDRISAFDVVLPNGVPDKGRVLNQLSTFWLMHLQGIVPNHWVNSDSAACLVQLGNVSTEQKEVLRGRMMLVQKALVIPIECVVRGYISGSLWKEYREKVKENSSPVIEVLGHKLPADLQESGELPIPIFTPATKSKEGHDINLDYEQMETYLECWLREQAKEIQTLTTVEQLARHLRLTSLALYMAARKYARGRGIIIADTKFEFGFINMKLVLIDEVLTPDSSRFWDMGDYKPGGPQPSFDKQYVRDWLEVTGWDKRSPAPMLPSEVVEITSARYREAYRRLIGVEL